MASPLRILTISNTQIRANKLAYVLDFTSERRVFYDGGYITTTDSVSTLQTLVPELITLTYFNGGSVYVNAAGITAIQTTGEYTLITLNTVGAISVTDSVSSVATAINNALNSSVAIGGTIANTQVAFTKDGNALASGILNENINSFVGLTDNTVLYVAAHGGTWSTVADLITPTKPTGATHLVQNVGICIRHTGGTTMKGFNVAAIGRTNDTPNQINIVGSITAAAFVTSGGTATQYVRGDGTVDSLELVDDTTPQLGGALDTQGSAITGNYATDGRRAISIEAGTTRTLAEVDAGDFIITTNASPVTVTIPDSATTAFTVGTEVDFIQKGAGALTISASGASVTLNGSAAGTVAVTAQWGGLSIKKIDVNEWIAVGKI